MDATTAALAASDYIHKSIGSRNYLVIMNLPL